MRRELGSAAVAALLATTGVSCSTVGQQIKEASPASVIHIPKNFLTLDHPHPDYRDETLRPTEVTQATLTYFQNENSQLTPVQIPVLIASDRMFRPNPRNTNLSHIAMAHYPFLISKPRTLEVHGDEGTESLMEFPPGIFGPENATDCYRHYNESIDAWDIQKPDKAGNPQFLYGLRIVDTEEAHYYKSLMSTEVYQKSASCILNVDPPAEGSTEATISLTVAPKQVDYRYFFGVPQTTFRSIQIILP